MLCVTFDKSYADSDPYYQLLFYIKYGLVFCQQGLIDAIYTKSLTHNFAGALPADSMIRPVVAFLYYMQYSLCTPTVQTGQGWLFINPIYNSKG